MALTKLNNRSLSGALTSSQVPASAASTALSNTPIQIVHSVFDTNLLIQNGINKFIEKAITTTSANSKILVMVNLIPYISGGGMDTGCGFTIQRKIGSGSYSVLEGSRDATGHQQFYIFNSNSGSLLICTFSDTCFDSPGTNSEVVRYQIYGTANSGGTVSLTSSQANHYITLMEIKQ